MTLKVPPVPIEIGAVDQARAIITTAWGNSGYRPLTVTRIESYYCDTSLDNDTDPWYLEIGDPDGDYLDTLHRDNEVRVKIFGVAGRKSSLPIVTGMADEIAYSTDGTLTFSGRDLSAMAVDSTVPPKTYRQKKAWAIVKEQARELGFTDTRLVKSGPEGNMVRKFLQTDGSESYWEFWYRLYRREKLWLWTEPDGTLIGDILNYTGDPIYYFGQPRRTDPRSRWNYYMPIERLEIMKSTQGRVGEVWVYGNRGNAPVAPAFVTDPTMRHWIKKPRKIMLDAEVRTHRMALKTAWEEIFEGKVGAVELKVTVSDPGFEIQQNEIAVLNLPEPGITGTYFVVGVRRQVGPEGLLQEVRLRERQYAITRRVPQDPKPMGGQGPSTYTSGDVGQALAPAVQAPGSWVDYFIKGANKWHGPWDYNLYLAVLLGICHIETNFQNERSNGWAGGSHNIWYPWKAVATATRDRNAPDHDQFGKTKQQWQAQFANENWDGQPDIAVGPMQLLSRNLKQEADDMMKSGFHDQYSGGRWTPEYNIMTAAHYLRTCLQIVVHDSGRDTDIYLGVAAYHLGPGAGHSALENDPYWKKVRGYVVSDPGYLNSVVTARQEASDAETQASKQPVVDIGDTSAGGIGTKNSAMAIQQLSMLEIPTSADVTHVDYKLLKNTNSLATRLGKKIHITSGYRPTGQPTDQAGAAGLYGGAVGGDTQWYLYNQYKLSGFSISAIAAYPGTSNHEKGEALDCQIGGQSIKKVVSASMLAQFGLHGTVDGDWPHITLLSVRG